MITVLNTRAIEIFRHIVEAYVEIGEPIGSQTISQRLGLGLSPATIRNVMAELEDSGLLYSPHKSAGRLPTEAGLKLFVDGILEVGSLFPAEQERIKEKCAAAGQSVSHALEEATLALAGLSKCTGLVIAPKTEASLKHIEFVSLGPGRALVVLVTNEGIVENRIIEVPAGVPLSTLIEASNYLNAHLNGKTLSEAREIVRTELKAHKDQLDKLACEVVELGLASYSESLKETTLIVRGQSHLLESVTCLEELERLRRLFGLLESKEAWVDFLDSVINAEGVQIFIGSQSNLFGISDCSMIVSPFASAEGKTLGVIGVIGPTRLNYARIIPLVDYTAKVISRLMG